MSIALPDNLKNYLFEQVSQGACNSPSEYIAQLIRADQKRKALENLETLVLEGIESGDAGEMTDEEWAALRRGDWQPQSSGAEP
ncbi:MAG: type II toxin-antitoxin system ParD family antitoxin [Pirellulales bacterium]|nr:type II toxin-antitoxin system ParD family antitoxin [Pirellulales bacterium]